MLYGSNFYFCRSINSYYNMGIIRNDHGSIPLRKTMLKAPCIDFATLKQITQSYADFLLSYGWGCVNVTLFMGWLPIF
jgi:hypothetical protein